MDALIEDFRNEWSRKPKSVLMKLIIINLGVFLGLLLLPVFWRPIESWLIALCFIPADFSDFLARPWTLLTYSFSHKNFFHILFNLYILYWFGRLTTMEMGKMRLLALYLYGGIAGGLLYLVLYNNLPFFMQNKPELGMVGASASIYAITTALATWMPNMRIQMIFIGEVRLKHIVLVVILLSFAGSLGSNAGGNIAHLGGAALGFLFAWQLKQGKDWALPVSKSAKWIMATSSTLIDWFRQMIKPKPKFRVSYKSEKKGSKTQESGADAPDQDQIDHILDKISQSGYDSLTTQEKQILFNASQKKT